MHPQPYQQVERRGANHALHAILTLLTCGLWGIFVWPFAAMAGRKTTTTAYIPPAPYGYPPQLPPGQPMYGQQLPPGQQPYAYPPQPPAYGYQPGPYNQQPPPPHNPYQQ